MLYNLKYWLKETDRGCKCKGKGRRITVLAEEDRELADVIEIEWDGISTGVTMNKQREGTEDKGVCEGERGQLCAWCVCVCVETFSYMPLSICAACMHVHVCVWGSSLWWGEGKAFALSPGTDWLTGVFPCGVLAVFVLHQIKTSLPGNTRGIVTYTKHHHTQRCPLLCLAHTSISRMYLFKLQCAHALIYHDTSSTSTINSMAHNKNWQPRGVGWSW